MTPNPSQSIEVFVDADFGGDAPMEETEEQDGSKKWKHILARTRKTEADQTTIKQKE
jgi:hypothetical protein